MAEISSRDAHCTVGSRIHDTGRERTGVQGIRRPVIRVNAKVCDTLGSTCRLNPAGCFLPLLADRAEGVETWAHGADDGEQ